jgi:Xaa-Pro aminopeptidase
LKTPRFLILVAFLFSISYQGRSQIDLSDPLGSAFRISAQSGLRSKLPPKSCAVLFSGGFEAYDATRQFPRPFYCDPDFQYLTGYRIPDAVVVIFSEPMTLSEGSVSTLLFLPDKTDYGLVSMGYEYRGKFGMTTDGIAIRPTAQWKKFCTEILAADGMERVFAKPIRPSDFRKPGDRDYNYLGEKMFSALAPGFAFDPQAQKFYKEILATDSTKIGSLSARIGAMMEYEMPEQKDPLLQRFMNVQTADDLRKVQGIIKGIKIDLPSVAKWLSAQRRNKSVAEITLIRKSIALLVKGFQAAAARLKAGNEEAKIQAVAEFVIHSGGGRLAMPVVVASGKSSARPNYTANLSKLPSTGLVVVDMGLELEGYHARATRTLPVGGEFGTELRSLYEGVLTVHRKSLGACVQGVAPSKIQADATAAFDALDKRLIFNTNALGARKVLKVTHLASIGLELEEDEVPATFAPENVIVVETALYLPDEEGITAKWRGTGIVLRDMVRVTDAGNQILTETLPLEPSAVELMVKSTFNLTED